MKRIVVVLLKTLLGVIVACVVLSLGLLGLLHTDFVQQKALKQAETLLREQLNTKVEIGSAQVSLFGQTLSIHDVTIEDLQHRKMLQMELLGVDLKWWRLLDHEVCITEARVSGLNAQLHKPRPDSAANFQFVIDAFKSKKKPAQDSVKTDKKKHSKLTLDVGKLTLERIKVSYNDTLQAEIQRLFYKENWKGRKMGEIGELKTAFVQHTKKGPVDSRLRIGTIDFQEQKDRYVLNMDSVCFATDNHKPRKNVGKPKRGFFDVGHFDIVAKLFVSIDHLGKDSLVARITDCHAVDRGSGLNLTGLRCKVQANKKTAHLSDVQIKMKNTVLAFDRADVQLPSKKEGRKLSYSTSTIKGHTLLKDISRPFAPVLSNFTLPLQLQTQLSGTDNGMNFRNVIVTTADKKFSAKATGSISNLKDKYKMQIHFDVHQMTAVKGSKERIIKQFPVKKFMMKQLHALGTIGYQGHLDILWKKEVFAGHLRTEVGNLQFQFALDELNKYVLGSVHTDSLELGKAMDMPDLGKIACKANFKFDISKPRTALMRKQKGGKLPIGHIDAEVAEAKYKFVKVRNLVAEINSDGAVAEGNITVKGKRVDMLCSFSFTNTNEMKKTKIKPGVKFHKLSEEAKAEKAERKQQKAAEKAERKQQKAAEKAERKQQKAEQKQQKAALKAEQKAAKQQQKELEKQQKELEKKKKAEEKAARKAAKAAKKLLEQAEQQ